MAEPVSGGPGNQSPKEMSMEVRLLLAFVLMGAVMFVSQYFFKSQAPPPGQKTAQASGPSGPSGASGAVTPPVETPPAPAPEAKAEAATDSGPATPEQALPPLVIDTDNFRVTFSNQGATVRSWQLKKYHDNDGKPLELVNTA